MKITEQEAQKRKQEVCNNCKHQLSYHIFWNHNKSILELLNCNECSCEMFESATSMPDANNSHLRKQGETSAVGNDVSNGVLDKRGETCPDSTPKEKVEDGECTLEEYEKTQSKFLEDKNE